MLLSKSHLRRFDWALFGSVLVILTLGLLAIASVTLSHETPLWGGFWKQLGIAGVGLLVVVFGSALDARSLRAWSRLLYLVAVLLLLAVLFFGTTIRGTRGWFAFFGMTLQPVELVKVFLLIFLAKYFAQWARDIDRLFHIVMSGVGVALLVGLAFLQPDIGSAFLLVALWMGLLLLAGLKRRHVLLLALLFVSLGVGLWFFGLHDYQRDRLTTFFQPGRDPLGKGYNITQAKIAVGSGQFFGRGLGFGSQSQLRFLPEAETDFIFAVIAEELGFIGVLLLFGAWAVFFWRSLLATRSVADDFSLFLLLGIALLFFIEFSVNVGMNIGFLPVTGLPLPFASAGGSSLVGHLLLLTVMESIIVRRRQEDGGETE